MHGITPGDNRLHFMSTLFGLPSSSSNNRDEDDTSLDVETKVKTRLLSMWNNVKYGMKLKTNFSKDTPVWLLGRLYHNKLENSDSTELATDVATSSRGNLTTNEDEGLEGFKSDFLTRIWMTYRREFPLLNGSTYSSDCGWGCMLRSGQMLLAQALVNHILSRSWRWNPDPQPITRDTLTEELNHRKIIKWFGDKPSRNSPFSIHELVKLGESSGKRPGDWYGPGFVAHLLRQAVKSAAKDISLFDDLTVYVAQDCAVYIEDVKRECTDENFDKWRAIILLIPVRLGTEKFNPVYSSSLTNLFSLEQCIGIIGGRPKHSLYFVGNQDDKLIHLDPHYCQEMVDVSSDDFPLSSFHCRSPRKMNLSKMDPSCCIGFYCSSLNDFYDLKEKLEMLVIPGVDYPMFVFSKGSARDARDTPKHYQPPPVQYRKEDLLDDSDFETEEFVVL